MTEERTVEREGLEAASEAFHEARVGSSGVQTRAEVVDVVIGESHDRLFVCLDDGVERLWVEARSMTHLPRRDLAERFGVEGSVEDLVGSRVELFIDRPEGVVRSRRQGELLAEIVEGVPVEEVVAEGAGPFGTDLTRTERTDEVGVEPDWAGDPGAFDRLLEAERALEYGEHDVPTREVVLEADGDAERVVVEATLGETSFEWEFEVPDPGEFETGELTAFVEAVGAGDPAGLDGHRVTVTTSSALGAVEEGFECEAGDVAIVPREELDGDEEDGAEGEEDGGVLRWVLGVIGIWLFVGGIASGAHGAAFVGYSVFAAQVVMALGDDAGGDVRSR